MKCLPERCGTHMSLQAPSVERVTPSATKKERRIPEEMHSCNKRSGGGHDMPGIITLPSAHPPIILLQRTIILAPSTLAEISSDWSTKAFAAAALSFWGGRFVCAWVVCLVAALPAVWWRGRRGFWARRTRRCRRARCSSRRPPRGPSAAAQEARTPPSGTIAGPGTPPRKCSFCGAC